METEIRDRLALDRTILANERTILSYVRTALAFAGLGIALLHLETTKIGRMMGWGCVLLGAAILMIGVFRYRIRTRRFHSTDHNA